METPDVRSTVLHPTQRIVTRRFQIRNVGACNPSSHQTLLGHPLLPDKNREEESLRFESSLHPTQTPWTATATQVSDASPSSPSITSRDALPAERVDSPTPVDAPLSEHKLSPLPPALTPRYVLERAELMDVLLSLSTDPTSIIEAHDALLSLLTAPKSTVEAQDQFQFGPASPALDKPADTSSWLVPNEALFPHHPDDDFDDFFHKLHADEYVVAGDIRDLDPQYESLLAPAKLSEAIDMPATANSPANAYDNVVDAFQPATANEMADAHDIEAVGRAPPPHELADECAGVAASGSEEVLGSARANDLADEHDHHDALDPEERDESADKTSARPQGPLPLFLSAVNPPSHLLLRVHDEWPSYEYESPEEEDSPDDDADGDYVETHSRAPKLRQNNRSKAAPARQPRLSTNATRKGKTRAPASRTTFRSASTASSSASSSSHSSSSNNNGSDSVGRHSPPSKRRRTNSGKALPVQQVSRSASTAAKGKGKGKGKAKAPAPPRGWHEYSSSEEDDDDDTDAYDDAEDDDDDSNYGSASSSSSKRRRSKAQPVPQPNRRSSNTTAPSPAQSSSTSNAVTVDYFRTANGLYRCNHLPCTHTVKTGSRAQLAVGYYSDAQ
ncbi:hypothetical protein R3P38DRAFT_3281602 [Favolaschia claudopus]|uniref:Uncharacterized protein n=1 Tax=Favolaschia claudopus TaxID=2862362 RepID=A0AAW0ADS5_9AGAR